MGSENDTAFNLELLLTRRYNMNSFDCFILLEKDSYYYYYY